MPVIKPKLYKKYTFAFKMGKKKPLSVTYLPRIPQLSVLASPTSNCGNKLINKNTNISPTKHLLLSNY